MIHIKHVLPTIASVVVFVACAQVENEPETNTVEPEEKVIQVAEKRHHQPHAFGGWYCPDNLLGFPPVDIKELHKVPVVEGRLPTEEETRYGKSLMYIDTREYPEARPLDIELPQLATIHSEHNKMDELIIVIQAVVIGKDTIVGYRFPNGGNGSAWYDQVSFLDNNEVENLGSKPFVYETVKINATTTEIWHAFASTAYAQNLGERFNKQDFINAEWTNHAMARLEYTLPGERAKGSISNLFGNLYLHIDYDLNGFHYSEKILVVEDPTAGISTVHLVAGPYRSDIETFRSDWQTWLAELVAESEN